MFSFIIQSGSALAPIVVSTSLKSEANEVAGISKAEAKVTGIETKPNENVGRPSRSVRQPTRFTACPIKCVKCRKNFFAHGFGTAKQVCSKECLLG